MQNSSSININIAIFLSYYYYYYVCILFVPYKFTSFVYEVNMTVHICQQTNKS